MRKRKFNLYLLIVILVLGLTLGYAYLTSTLNINGATQIDRTVWNVHFENVQMMPGSVEGAAPTISANTTSVSFSTRLQKPGDYYAFYIDAKNDGTIDAMVSDVVSKINNVPITTLPSYLEYKITYDDEYPIEENHLLKVNEKESYLIIVKYKDDINANDLPSTAQSLNMSFETTYEQADNNAVERDRYVYFLFGEEMQIGDTIPSDYVTYRNSYDPNLPNTGLFIRTLTDHDGLIKRAFIGYTIFGPLIYFEGGVIDDNIFQDNRTKLIQYSSNCNIASDLVICDHGHTENGKIWMYGYRSNCAITSLKWIACYQRS